MNPIPFNRPHAGSAEAASIQDVLTSGHLSGCGPVTLECERLLSDLSGGGRVLLTTSCTHALEMSALLLDIKPGDEVVVPSFTFVSTANAFALRGAKIRFADIDSTTFNLEPASVSSLLTDRTRAIVPVHYAGVGCDMKGLLELGEATGVPLIEDNAHGLCGAYEGRPLGSFGSLATLSFHETKNFSCGEGGAIVINDPTYVERAEILREKGTNRSRFFRGEVDKYTWVDLGSSWPPSEILAAFLAPQLRNSQAIQARRETIWKRYDEALRGKVEEYGVRTPFVPENVEQAFHMYHLLLPSAEARAEFIRRMKEQYIHCVFHYLPLHRAPGGMQHGGEECVCPVTDDISERLVRIPFFHSLTEAEQDRVIDTTLASLDRM